MEQQTLVNIGANAGMIYDFSNIKGLPLVERRLQEIVNDSEYNISSYCNKIIKSGGKRIRPILALLSGQCMGELNQDIIEVAVAVELIHTASLVHDDIIDKALTRRGTVTINCERGNHFAVLCGDFLFAKTFEILSDLCFNKSINGNNVMKSCINAIKEMCDGEIRQANEKLNWHISEDVYMQRIYKKTASLISISCIVGGICGGGEEKEVDALRTYGENIGYAFQIVDDICDYIYNSSQIGKTSGMDLIEGNITLPVILLIKEESENCKLKNIMNKDTISRNDFEFIRELIGNNRIIEKCKTKALFHIEKAKESLNNFNNKTHKALMLKIADMIINKV